MLKIPLPALKQLSPESNGLAAAEASSLLEPGPRNTNTFWSSDDNAENTFTRFVATESQTQWISTSGSTMPIIELIIRACWKNNIESTYQMMKIIKSRTQWIDTKLGGRSWRASGDRQISLNASAERAFANFRDKKHRILQLQIFAT